jgi:hypothetical protein
MGLRAFYDFSTFIQEGFMKRTGINRGMFLGLSAAGMAMVLGSGVYGQAKPAVKPEVPVLKPAVAFEAEEFKVESGWKVLKIGEGNYSVDIIGFGHIGNERFLSLPAEAKSASAYLDVQVPEAGPYKLWVRYEYPAFTETRFKAVVEQGGKVIAQKVLGAKDNPKLHFNKRELVPQYDPPWGPEGVFEEPMDVPDLAKGPARIRLVGVEQPQVAGVSANRNIDLIYLTRDVAPFTEKNAEGKEVPNKASWYYIGGAPSSLYPILNAYRDTRGARWEARITNKGATATKGGSIKYTYNRGPWYVDEPVAAIELEPGQTSQWIGLSKQDTCHYGAVTFALPAGKAKAGEKADRPAIEVEIRPVGGGKSFKFVDDEQVMVYVPAYPGFGDEPASVLEKVKGVTAYVKSKPAPGREPKEPLAFGGWMPISGETDYGRAYGDLYKTMGFRAFPLAIPKPEEAMKSMELPFNVSAQAMGYRQPPTEENIDKAKAMFEKNGLLPYLRFFDYGDEIHFSEWIGIALGKEKLEPIWAQWLKENRPEYKAQDYWRASWGAFDAAKIKPDSTAAASKENPKLYVDSVAFYEDLAYQWVSKQAKQVKAKLGPQVLAGANYAAHPFYYPTVPMYVTWFRKGAADYGRHSEYFWQVGQAGPMINGYIVELFRSGMRHNPNGYIRQYTMPHAPGNTEASFLRTAFTHLAHGANGLDYFGIGLNETFTENHIDHRANERFKSIRDINYSLGMVDDVWSKSKAVPSQAAILVSYSTELWDLAPIAGDKASHAMFSPGFRAMRLNYHIDRVGLWKATTFAGVTPDLLVEEDMTAEELKGYKVLFVVGDCLPVGTEKALEAWVQAGGTLVATSGVGTYGTYREPNPGMQALVGIASRKLEERDTFMRPMQDLQFMKPSAMVKGDGFEFPALGNVERITPVAGAKTVAKFDDGTPAIIERAVGKGKVIFIASEPGAAYFWSALQPNIVPDRADNTHRAPQNWDKGVGTLVGRIFKDAGANPMVTASLPNIDARLIKGPKVYILPVSNYSDKIGQACTLTVSVSEPVADVVASYNGKLVFKQDGGKVVIQVPKLGYGEMVRINLK